MRFQGTVVEDEKYTFGILVVQESTLKVPSQASEMQNFAAQVFGDDIPIVLMATNSEGKSSYFGSDELVTYLSTKDPKSLDLTWLDV
jgi:hypothetical protein